MHDSAVATTAPPKLNESRLNDTNLKGYTSVLYFVSCDSRKHLQHIIHVRKNTRIMLEVMRITNV